MKGGIWKALYRGCTVGVHYSIRLLGSERVEVMPPAGTISTTQPSLTFQATLVAHSHAAPMHCSKAIVLIYLDCGWNMSKVVITTIVNIITHT